MKRVHHRDELFAVCVLLDFFDMSTPPKPPGRNECSWSFFLASEILRKAYIFAFPY